MIKAGILGASGYMGGEALRILTEHPDVKVKWATSRNQNRAEQSHRNLYGADIDFIHPDEITPCDVIFVALPTGNAMKLAVDISASKTRLIDLGADFRLKDINVWQEVYGQQHACPKNASEAVYGIPELHRREIQATRIVANPGCYSSAAILGLAPLIKENLIDLNTIVVDGLSGTSGAGADLDLPIHHPEIANNLIPYNVVDHRHTYEMEQELGILANRKVTVHFTTTYVPITRGILAICHCFPVKTIDRQELIKLYHDFYEMEYFVKVFDMPKESHGTWQYKPYPWVAAVSGTNFCHIGLDIDEKRNRIVIFSVLDSLGKGGAHAGVQNMNLLFGLDERTGLNRYGMHPY